MQFTHRQRQRGLAAAALWALLTALCAMAGPFGTHDAMGLTGRIGYWGFVVAVSILGSVLVSLVNPRSAVLRLGVWIVYAVGLALVVFAMNAVLFPARGQSGLLYLLGIICVSVVVVNGVVYLARGAVVAGPVTPPETPDPQARFLRRLPLDIRAPLVRIEAQDHYLNVVTAKGSSLILMRLAEAVDELQDAGGLQTHRSHWVRLAAVEGHRRVDGRDVLTLQDGAQVPVARTRRDAARAAGLF